MVEVPNCIYDIFFRMGVAIKYTGFLPLPGVYEPNKSRMKNPAISILINQILPLFALAHFAYSTFTLFYLGMPKSLERNLTDILLCLMIATMFLGNLSAPLLYRFRSARLLRDYLRLHARVDPLLRPRKPELTAFVNRLVWANCALYTCLYFFMHAVRVALHRSQYWPLELISFLNCLFGTLGYASQPQSLYLVFQRVLNVAFEQLLLKVKKNGGRGGAKELREIGRLQRSLCELSRRLDHLVSPLMVYAFLFNFLVMIYYFTMLSYTINFGYNLPILNGILASLIVILLVPNFAYLTQRSMSKIVPAVYSTFKLNEKNLQDEGHLYGLQSLQFQYSFSASKLFYLDRNLIVSVTQSIISQWMVFKKIHNESVK